jgi:hypothetical protein
MRKNLSMFLCLLAIAGMLVSGCTQASSGSSSGGSSDSTTTDKYAHVRFQRTIKSGDKIAVNLYSLNISSASYVNLTFVGVDPSSISNYVDVMPGSYYVGWGVKTQFSSTTSTYDKGKYYTDTLDTLDANVTITCDK